MGSDAEKGCAEKKIPAKNTKHGVVFCQQHYDDIVYDCAN